MTADELQAIIAAGLSCTHLMVEGDGRHWSAVVVSEAFAGFNLPGALLACCLGGALGLWQDRGFSFQPGGAAAVQALVSALEAHGVRAAFSHDGLLQWQIAFYSGTRIVVRSTAAEDRYPPYLTAANALLERAPEAVAEVGNPTIVATLTVMRGIFKFFGE